MEEPKTCDCEISKVVGSDDLEFIKNLFLKQREANPDKEVRIPDGNRLAQIRTPTDCQYCLSIGMAHFCDNKERINIYEQERR